MSTTPGHNKISACGSRYVKKQAGSIFATPLGNVGGHTLSCFFCGKHRVRAERTGQMVLGKRQQVCTPACERNPASKRSTAAATPEQSTTSSVTGDPRS